MLHIYQDALCFFANQLLKKLEFFDEGIFMYGEDTDLNRRIFQKYRTMYYPSATITHAFEKGSHKKISFVLDTC